MSGLSLHDNSQNSSSNLYFVKKTPSLVENDTTIESFSGAPTAVPTLNLDNDEKSKKDDPGIAITAMGTIDTLTLDEKNETPELAKTSTVRKITLLIMFTLATFLDAFNNSALFPAIPKIASQLKFEASETAWIISAYQLTFAAFLLVSGRISDVYTPKPAFLAGLFILSITHLIGGFTHQKIALLVLRALGGIGGALTIPSALSLIIQLFPDPSSQARAIALFGSGGAIGNVSGILIGAVLVQYAGWPWIFWFTAILGIGIATVCLVLIPGTKREKGKDVKFDVPGLSLLTSGVILFIFAVTSGSAKGWGTAYVLTPLIISILIVAVFFWWEAHHTNPDDAVLPPRMWRYHNFAILIALALIPYVWWITAFVSITAWWEQYYGWSAINTAVHFLPIGIGAWLISNVTGQLPKWFPHKYILLGGLTISIISTILLPFADSPSTYWPIVFPAFTLGTMGSSIIYANSSIAIFSYTPPSVAGTVGAVLNCALQLGSALGLAIVYSISTSIDAKSSFNPPTTEWSQHLEEITKSMWKQAYKGRAAAYWFLLGILGAGTLAVILFFKVDVPVHEEKRQSETKDIEASRSRRVVHDETIR